MAPDDSGVLGDFPGPNVHVDLPCPNPDCQTGINYTLGVRKWAEGGSVQRHYAPMKCPKCHTDLPQPGLEHYAPLEKPLP
jgi:hypothetical protein